MTTEAGYSKPAPEDPREREWAAHREDMRDTLISDEEELRLEKIFFDAFGLDDMSKVDFRLKNGTRIQYFPSVDRKNRQLKVWGNGLVIEIGRNRDLSGSAPWVLEGAYAHFSLVDDRENKVGVEFLGIDAIPLVEAEFNMLFGSHTVSEMPPTVAK